MLGYRSGPNRIPMQASRGSKVAAKDAALGLLCTAGPAVVAEGVAGTVAARIAAATASAPDWLPVALNSCALPPSRFL